MHGIDDEADGAAVRAAFREMGVADEEVGETWRLVAGALCLGDLSFAPAGDGCSCAAEGAASEVARLWGVGVAAVQQAVTVRTIEVRGTSTEIPLRADEAPAVAAAFAKSAYHALFTQLVGRINGALAGQRGPLILSSYPPPPPLPHTPSHLQARSTASVAASWASSTSLASRSSRST